MGLITYIRTSSTHVSNNGIGVAMEYIVDEIGEAYFKPRKWGEEGAHECIRPTRPINSKRLVQLVRDGIIKLVSSLTKDHLRLYELIFNRFIASQMIDASITYEKITVNINGKRVEVEGYVDIISDGWTRVKSPNLMRVPRVKKGESIRVIVQRDGLLQGFLFIQKEIL